MAKVTKRAASGGKGSTANITAEFGATGLRQYSGYVREEWLRELIGRRGQLMLREMRDNDPIIAAIFFAIEMLLRGVPFHVEPVDSTNPDDNDAADFIQSCLGDMEMDFASLLAEILSFLQYGWSVHEICYKMRKGASDDPIYNSEEDDGMIGWRKFAVRSQETLLHWVFSPAGDATHLVQLLPTGGPLLNVPLNKCLHIRTTPYKGNPEGRSILRSMYTSYHFKKYIQETEAIGVQRDLTGMVNIRVPAAWLSPDAPPDMKASLQQARDIATQISRNQQEGLVTPFMYDDKDREIFKIELVTTGGRRQFATTEILNRYDHGIASSMLADFITLGTGSSRGVGSFAQSKNKSDLFSVAVVAYLDLITAGFNRKAIPDLLSLNNLKGKVQMVHGDIARRDLDELGSYILDLAQAGVLTPDGTLEAHAREEGGLPAQDADASRDLADGGEAGGTGGDNDPADNKSGNVSRSQGRGGGASAADLLEQPKGAIKRRRTNKRLIMKARARIGV